MSRRVFRHALVDEVTHHAVLVSADSIADAPISEVLKQQDADIQHFVFLQMGIDDARKIGVMATRKPVLRDTRVLVIFANRITTEAQNALLKLFEEPPLSTRFVVVMPLPSILLPTLLSRFHQLKEKKPEPPSEVFDAFRKSQYRDRLTEITLRTKDKDTVWIEAIFSGSEYFAHSCTDIKEKESLLRTVLFVRQYAGARGSSSKMLLEELAISLPVKQMQNKIQNR